MATRAIFKGLKREPFRFSTSEETTTTLFRIGHRNPSQRSYLTNVSREPRRSMTSTSTRNVSTSTRSSQVQTGQKEEPENVEIPAPSATLLDGLVAAADIRLSIKTEIEAIRVRNADFTPGLAIVQVGNREDSNVYIRMKIKNAKDVGIYTQHVRLPRLRFNHCVLKSTADLRVQNTFLR